MRRLSNFLIPAILFCLCGIMGLFTARIANPDAYLVEHPVPQLNCMSYSPFYHFLNYNPRKEHEQPIKPEWVKRDMEFLSQYTKCIRIYTSLNGMEIVPPIAKEYGISVIAGSYFYENWNRTRKDIDGLIKIANRNDNVVRVIVGNDTIHYTESNIRKTEITTKDMALWIDFVKDRVKQPVSTAEGSIMWLNSETIGELPKHVEFVAANILPYWLESPDVATSQREFINRYRALQKKYPKLEIMITELGWPNRGSPWGEAQATPENAYQTLLAFTALAKEHGIPYVYFEAFDQPWKITETQGRTESHWGLFDTNYNSNFVSYHFMVDDFVITYLDIAYLIIALIFFLLWSDFTFGIDRWSWFSSAMLAHLLGYFFASTLATLIKEYVYRDILFCLLMIPAGLTLVLSLVHKTRTALQVIGDKPLKRSYDKLPVVALGADAPFVSIHIPCRNEEPEHVIACVQSLIDQDYPNFEVIVIDNNSTDEKYWRPLETFCLSHPDKVKFLHVEKLAGFKAGALAYALDYMHPDTAVVGLVDADYIVEPTWLKDCVPYFREGVGAVQAPQDYVQEFDSLFMRSIYDEYVGFFRIGMVQRNESNSIIQHGTMLLLNRTALEKSGSWQTDTIVEDTDLGMRLLINGYECLYINKVYGRGRMPTRFAEYKKQRFRWSYGAMRTIIKYAPYLLWFKKGLTFKQRVHFILGWVPWLGNAFHPLFVFGAILLSYFYIKSPDYVVTSAIFMPILVYVLLDTWFSGFLYSARLGLPIRRILFSFVAGASLVWTIGRGILTGIFYSSYPFKVTKKGKTQITKNLGDNFPLIVSLVMLAMDAVMWMRYTHPLPPDVSWWMVLLLVLSFPGIACALMTRFESVKPKP